MISTVLQGLRGQRKTAALMSAVLVIAFFFMTIASIILSSVQEAQQQERERIYGNFQLLFYGNSTAADRLAEQNPGSRISSIVGKTGSGQTVATITSSFQEYANLDIIQGRLPENEGEILLVGPDVWDHQPGDTVKISYTFHHVAPLQTGALIEVEEEIKQIKQQLVLNEIPNRLKPNMIAYWNNEVGNENHNEWVEAFLPEYMLKPYNQLSSEQKNQALVFVYEHGPFFENANRIDLGDFAAFDTKDALQYPKDQMTVNGMQVYLNLAGSSVTLVGGGFREYMGTVISQEPLLTDSRVDVTYTVCGIAQEYKDNWGTNGLSMPDAFVTPEGLDVVREVLDRVEEKYPYVLPQSKASLLLWQGGEDYDPFLRSYNDLYSASYRLMGQSTQVHSTRAFLLGIDPATGEEIAYNVIGDYVDIGDSRHYFLEGDLTDPDFRLEGLDPLPMEPVTEQMLYNNNTGILRINSHAYPPVGDATGTIQLLLQGVLIGMSVCSCFQIYLQSLKRRKQKLDTLIAIGATDGQLVTILLMEVVLLLAASCILGAGLGCLGGLIVLKSILEIPMVWDFTSILPAYGLMSGAVLLGVLLPILKILREQLQKHRKKVRPVRVYRSRGSGYRSIRLRHNRVNRRQTLLRNVIILFLCAILLLPVFLIHRSFDSYRQNVTYADRPEYELQLPYGAAMRHLNEITEEIDVPLEKLRSYVTAENVYLHCDDFLSESPILKTLASDSRGSALFRKLDNRDTGFLIRMVTTAWDSELIQTVVASSGKNISQEDFEKGRTCILLVPRYREEVGQPVLSDISAEVLAETSQDLQAGVLLESSFQEVYAENYRQDDALLSLETIQISGYTQRLVDSGSRLVETMETAEVKVAAAVCQLEEPLWPFSNEAGITVLCSVNLLDSVYPEALTRMDGQDSRYFRAASELYYPHCYGKSYVQLWTDESRMDTASIERSLEALCEKHDFDLVKYHFYNQNLRQSAQHSSALYLVFCINVVLITLLLLFNLLREEVEEDRQRIGILQVLGMTDRQYLLGQESQMAAMGIASMLIFHVLLILAIWLGFQTQGGNPSDMMLQMKLVLQDYPVWWNVGLCLVYLLALAILEIYAVLPILRKPPAESIR